MYFSVNVQAIGDANLNILNLVARWPGSTHDATIFNNSRVRVKFPVLAYGLRLKIDTALTVIVATGVLYNFAKLNNEAEAPPAEGIEQNELEHLIQAGQMNVNPNALGHDRNIRQQFINDYFTNLL
ncbi:hypothetical protein RN001_003683 [Aquatica leii]|uniref:DDE Tnp4 domain-containing protein n=1 Tax=Aquatica leii TaxID=1421715 RepID=A0AAN7PIP8_9COLE|nr:hypothetical protein RN001_003683 [Aquatica leii]